ncbi:Tyrosinase 2 [Colletotrichum chlorophyti]|uniref:Tyrosinase 2 n=1 Tax=Colletotrichum chlorophyti TaxID=708187 RepID=A0A1Q8RG93_9PEZI|nr:Tyrosinase 2 [Colletotrichum chlorophyti]
MGGMGFLSLWTSHHRDRDGPDEIDFSDEEIDSGNALARLNDRALQNARSLLNQDTQPGPVFNSSCQGDNVLMRKEWRSLAEEDRLSFIGAVQCMMRAPPLSDRKRVPMAKSLYDDFVAVHYTNFQTTHMTASFFAWHRYYLVTFEQKLRTQCGYKGALPYWEWGLDVDDPAASPLFDGSATSLGSDGAAIPHDGLRLRQSFSQNLIVLPPGTGGGCIKTGPFANMTVHIGPANLPQYGTEQPFSVANPLLDVPRCLKRDLNKYVASSYTSFRNSTSLILLQKNIQEFTTLLQGDDRFYSNTLGVQGGSFIFGGDPGADGRIAPGDPAFWVHQAQVDRLYWIWQNQDFENRQGVFGTVTFQDNPRSQNGTVEDFVDIAPLNTPVKVKDLINTVAGTPLCYMYQ